MEFKERTCLKCEKTFYSYGPQNRICEQCHRDLEKVNKFYAIPFDDGSKKSFMGANGIVFISSH